MGNCPNHVGEVILNLVRDARVRVITWPPHTTQIFQELDISLFEILKWRAQYQLPFDDDEGTATFILKTHRTFKQTMIETNIWGAFHEADFEFDFDVNRYRIRFDAEKLRRSSAFQEIWSPNFPFDRIPVRWQATRFGWISKLE